MTKDFWNFAKCGHTDWPGPTDVCRRRSLVPSMMFRWIFVSRNGLDPELKKALTVDRVSLDLDPNVSKLSRQIVEAEITRIIFFKNYLQNCKVNLWRIFCFTIHFYLWEDDNIGKFKQRTLTYFVRGCITVWLTSCLTGLDLTKQVNLFLIKHKQSSKIQTQ